MTDPILDLASNLIARPSVSPEDRGCQQVIAERLAAIGFEIEHMPFEDVSNLWATRGDASPTLVFAGHTDVVPVGSLESWHSDPFEPTLRDGYLYGRGAADMKSSLAAMVVAAERFVANHPVHAGRLGFLITSDEEDVALHGTKRVVETLQERGEVIDCCLVGEPSSTDRLGDAVRVRQTRFAERQTHLTRPFGSCRVPGCNAKLTARSDHLLDATGPQSLGRRQRVLSSDIFSDFQPQWRHRRGKRHPRSSRHRLQLPIQHRTNRGITERRSGSSACTPRPSRGLRTELAHIWIPISLESGRIHGRRRPRHQRIHWT